MDVDDWSARFREFTLANDDLRPKSAPTADRRNEITHFERREKTQRWWRAFAALAEMAVEGIRLGEHNPEFANPLKLLHMTARDLARGRVPPLVSDAASAGNLSSEAMERDLDLATAYLLACEVAGYTNTYGTLAIKDPKKNQTIAEWFGATPDTVRKDWKRRELTHEVQHTEDEFAFSRRVKHAGGRYKLWGRSGRRGG